MICSKFLDCYNCTNTCAYWFLLFENGTNGCFPDVQMGDPIERYIGSYLGCNGSLTPFSSSTTMTTTTLSSTSTSTSSSSTQAPEVMTTSSIILRILLGIGFLVVVGVALYCWRKHRSAMQQVVEARSLMLRHFDSQSNPPNQCKVHFTKEDAKYENLGMSRTGNSAGQKKEKNVPILKKSIYDAPTPPPRDYSSQGPSQIMTVHSADGTIKCLETRF